MNEDYYIDEYGSLHNKPVEKKSSTSKSRTEITNISQSTRVETNQTWKPNKTQEDSFWMLSVVISLFIALVMSMLLSDWSMITGNDVLAVIYPLVIFAGSIATCIVSGKFIIKEECNLYGCFVSALCSFFGCLIAPIVARVFMFVLWILYILF